MLSRHDTWIGFKSIPETNNKYLISIDGIIIDTIKGITYSSDINNEVEIFNGVLTKFYKQSVLFARKVIAINADTSEEYNFNSLTECAIFLKISGSALNWKLKFNPNKPINNFIVKIKSYF